MLVEYLVGELGGLEDQTSASSITRLIIAGNTFASTGVDDQPGDQQKAVCSQIVLLVDFPADTLSQRGISTKLSSDSIASVSDMMHELASVMPVHLLPGPCDPSGVSIPQRPFPPSIFGKAMLFTTFSCETNPAYLQIAPGDQREATGPSRHRTILVTSGQPLNDMCRYHPSPPITRLRLAESTLIWRHMSPTAPDTLCCHPFATRDPFVMRETPDIYVIGNQPRFQTKLVLGRPDNTNGTTKRCRVVLVPEFARSGVLVLVNLKTLIVRTVQFSAGI